MPALSVFVDGKLQARVSTDGLDVLVVSISGARFDAAFATLEVSGSVHPESGESSRLLWLDQHELVAGQCVRVQVAESGSNSHEPRAQDELPPEPLEAHEDLMLDRDQLLEQLQTQLHCREQVALTIDSSMGTRLHAVTTASEIAFAARLLWNSVRPEQVSAAVHSCSFDQLKAGGNFKYHYRELLRSGEWVEFRLGL